MSNDILIVAEIRENNLKKVSLEVLGAGQEIARKLGGTVVALVLGNGVTGFVAEMEQAGAAKVFLADSPALAEYSPTTFTQVIVKLVKETNPAAIFFGSTAYGRDLAPRVAARLKAGVASDCTGIEVADGRLLFTRPIYAGKAITQVKLKSDPQIATIRPNIYPIPQAETGRNVPIEKLEVNVFPGQAVTKAILKPETQELDVAEADIIVSGGRGLKGPENFAILRELADALGGAVGASRAAVDAGWIPHAHQVGQTGKTVNPSLYVACGISGAVQHQAGMRTSRVIVAINKDPESPIFKLATYGIVGDLFEVVPALTAEVKKLHGS
ncbi:MAG: electron transfer flavoprotein subunit alpha/FixB family protein [Chloroflexi bacterium]|nr:electron transfer flavoprotein subunit alpha/FixB family protein [Chloroflexota bacterium]